MESHNHPRHSWHVENVLTSGRVRVFPEAMISKHFLRSDCRVWNDKFGPFTQTKAIRFLSSGGIRTLHKHNFISGFSDVAVALKSLMKKLGNCLWQQTAPRLKIENCARFSPVALECKKIKSICQKSIESFPKMLRRKTFFFFF